MIEERIQGIEHPLPPGERVRWQGRPRAGLLAKHVLHVRAIAGYFGVIVVLWALRYAGELPRAQFVTMLLGQLVLGGLVVAGAFAFAWALARTSVYAITDRRVVIRTGIAFPMTINVPLRVVEGAALKAFRDGSGEIAIALEGSDRLAFLALWPHARPWRFKTPQPALRGLPGADEVGRQLQQAVTDFAAREGLPAPTPGAGADAAPRAAALAHDPAVA